MITETFRPLFHEIFTKVNNAKDKPKKVKVLQKYDSDGLRKLLKASFDPKIKWLLPEGNVPYVPNDAPDGTEHERLELVARTFKNYVGVEQQDGTIISGNQGLNRMKREMLFISLLEGLTQGEAEVLLAAKDKTLNKKFKGLNANTVKEAFNWDDEFMRRDRPQS